MMQMNFMLYNMVADDDDDFFGEVSASSYRLGYIFGKRNHLPKELKSRIP